MRLVDKVSVKYGISVAMSEKGLLWCILIVLCTLSPIFRSIFHHLDRVIVGILILFVAGLIFRYVAIPILRQITSVAISVVKTIIGVAKRIEDLVEAIKKNIFFVYIVNSKIIQVFRGVPKWYVFLLLFFVYALIFEGVRALNNLISAM